MSLRLRLLVPLLASALFALSGCQIGYLMKSAYSQAELLRRRVPIEEALKDPRLTAEQKRKLRLAEDAHHFAETDLGLAHTMNYTSYVQLDAPYVTWVVSASAKDELKHYLWKYPLVGEMPYKGFFDPEGARAQADELKADGLDTYIRGVSAYSTLGWFRDPVLSSMLVYKDYDLVSTIIHETTHATVFIKSEADFNERLAEFIGQKGAEAFYLKREGPDGATLKKMRDDLEDEQLFGDFISRELKSIEAWYSERKGTPIPEEVRLARLKEIQTRFAAELKPKLRDPNGFSRFEKADLNNARLLTYKLYFQDLSQFQKVFDKLGHDFKKMLEFCRGLEKSKDPVADLAKAASA
jgi:predicted aminopeptidase